MSSGKPVVVDLTTDEPTPADSARGFPGGTNGANYPLLYRPQYPTTNNILPQNLLLSQSTANFHPSFVLTNLTGLLPTASRPAYRPTPNVPLYVAPVLTFSVVNSGEFAVESDRLITDSEITSRLRAAAGVKYDPSTRLWTFPLR